LHIGKWRAGLHGDDQLVRLIGDDRVQRGEIDHRVGRHRMADSSPGTMADDLERLLGGDRCPHHLLDVFSISYLPDVYAYRPAFPPQPLLVSTIPSIGIDAGHKGGHGGRQSFRHHPLATDSGRDPGDSICMDASTNIEAISSILRPISNYLRPPRM